jgi:hypothetical protein
LHSSLLTQHPFSSEKFKAGSKHFHAFPEDAHLCSLLFKNFFVVSAKLLARQSRHFDQTAWTTARDE